MYTCMNVVPLIQGDKAKVSTSRDFVSLNVPQVELLISTWLGLASALSPSHEVFISDLLCGAPSLSSAIGLSVKIADEVIAHVNSHGFSWENFSPSSDLSGMDLAIWEPQTPDTLGEVLQVLRYPKRFTYLEDDLLQRQVMVDFHAIQERCRQWNVRLGREAAIPNTLANRILDSAREECSLLLGEYIPMRKNPLYYINTLGLGRYSNGHTQDCPQGDSRPSTKYAVRLLPLTEDNLSYHIDEPKKVFFPSPTQLAPTSIRSWSRWEEKWGDDDLSQASPLPDWYVPGFFPLAPDMSAIMAAAGARGVPKNYKIGRGIAEENSSRQLAQECIRRLIVGSVRCHRSRDLREGTPLGRVFGRSRYCGINVSTQSHNQLATLFGSLDGFEATIDLSQASDTICFMLAKCILPTEVFRDVCSYRSLYYWDLGKGGTLRCNHMWLTSGAPPTHVLEGVIFLSIVRAAYGEWLLWHEDPGNLIAPLAFGDDLVVDRRVADLVFQFLEAVGAKVNPDKSFIQGHYRESCGIEFYRGHEVSSTYWPRKALAITDNVDGETYAALVDLQHRFYAFPSIRQQINDVLRKSTHGKVTFAPMFGDLDLVEPWSAAYQPDKIPEFIIRRNGVYYESHYTRHYVPRVSVRSVNLTPAYTMCKYRDYLLLGPLPRDKWGVGMSRLATGDYQSRKTVLQDIWLPE